MHKFGKSISKQYGNLSLFLMFVPAISYYVIFHYLPMYGILISFKDFRILDGIMNSPWVGLKHYNFALMREGFWVTFKNTLIISGNKLIFGFPAPIILALLMNEVKNLRFKKYVQTVSYLPHFLSWVVLSGIVISFLSPSDGPINAIIKALGGKTIYFVADEDWFRTLLVVSQIWKEVGWGTIVYLAALTSVNQETYEAADIDGANRFIKAWHISIPSISHVVVLMFILAVGGIVNDDFDQIFNLYSPAVYRVGDVLSTYIYREGLVNMNYSYSAAIVFFRNSIAFVLILLTNTISKKVSDQGLW